MRPPRKGTTLESVIQLRKLRIQENSRRYREGEQAQKPPIKARKVT